ncbi:MAG: TetR/AcrR family transcriptional regulator [Anaerotignum sp.]|nr:TetR/AcrR family transcriptional regulator [Anaerotignum sp.]MBQ3615220.1 TetR/AcrR family transcriptional regulator [Anaerotignum sp.]MBQ7084378.1 TetR/AcrR family transcriptional regulator [Anaerotignum sp.]MBR2383827.1 TetR/AcrR family transcriptional regulator [Anaerotignum sp.]MBR2851422.1 TetR/AcrR family transcriptional regulator [Anaerotignum sp.]
MSQNKYIFPMPDTAAVYLAQALMELMEKKSLEEISITELTKKAGVSRMSYYRSFTSKQHILEEYLQIIVQIFRSEGEKAGYLGKEHGYLQLLYAFRFFRHHKRYALCLHNANLSSILLDGLNKYMDQYMIPPKADFQKRCKTYAYAGALYNLYIQWLKDDMQETEETMAEITFRIMFPHSKLPYEKK